MASDLTYTGQAQSDGWSGPVGYAAPRPKAEGHNIEGNQGKTATSGTPPADNNNVGVTTPRVVR